MSTLVLDRGAVIALARRTRANAALIAVLRRNGQWPPQVPAAVLVECLTGQPRVDADVDRLLATCHVVTDLPEPVARRAAHLRHRAQRGSAVAAVVVATAERGGSVLTGDLRDVAALAAHADGVTVERI